MRITGSRRKRSGNAVLIVPLLLLISVTTSLLVVEGFTSTTTTTTKKSSNARTLPLMARKRSASSYQQQQQLPQYPFSYDRFVKSTSSTSSSSTSRQATKDERRTDDADTEQETWSRSGERSSSRFGVRRRVRAVLEKARNRTGVRNINSQLDFDDDDDDDYEEDFPGQIVAEAASIGGFDRESNLVFRRSDTNGITPKTNGASTTAPKTNGATNGATTNGAIMNGSAAVMPQKQQQQQREVYPRNSTDSDLVLESSTTTTMNGAARSERNSNSIQVDAMLNSKETVKPLEEETVVVEPKLFQKVQEPVVVEPLPFTLPQITKEQRELLAAGERIQEQSKMGREGKGFVVLDVKAPPYAVWECLLDFEAYPENIGTVRSMKMFTNTHLKSSYISEKPVLPGTGRETRHYGNASITRAKFVLSKFRLNIAAIHEYRPHPAGHYMEFTLDKACTNLVLQDAKGIWYTQSDPDGRGEEYTRVWLFCEVQVSPMLPSFIVDYAANKAMPRATAWLKPTVEAAAKEFLQPLKK